ncbi:hypothetical protein HYC85_029574 [Camellia sinensis]|uniref:Uncharacterized protein n=1 Tax=Camellia sinensis TaxID=4442 RepID=A0A7J7FYB1_CAMSI|nr:hypothetical protein HYC85_029574 [Camellia sinensis]
MTLQQPHSKSTKQTTTTIVYTTVTHKHPPLRFLNIEKTYTKKPTIHIPTYDPQTPTVLHLTNTYITVP